MAYQDKNFPPKADQLVQKYTDAEIYDRRGESSVLESYVLGLWQPFLKRIVSNLSVGKIVIDLGCGTGEYTKAAKNAKKIYAIDISSGMLKICREKLKDFNQVEVIESRAENFNMPSNESADLVITIGVWEYINPLKLVFKIKEVTRRSSKVIVVFPNIYNDLNWMRSIAKGKMVALRPSFMRRLFCDNFALLDMASLGMVFWVPKRLQFLAVPIWKFGDFIWGPFQKFWPLGVNVYYLFERK